MAFCDQTRLFGHEASAPVRAVGWHRFQCLGDDVFNLLIGDLARRADPRLIQQAIQPKLSKPLPPLTDGRAGDVQLPRDLRVAHPLPTTEHDPGAHRHGLRRLRPTRDHAQFLAILIDDFQRFLGTTCAHTQVCSRNLYLCNVFLAQDTRLCDRYMQPTEFQPARFIGNDR